MDSEELTLSGEFLFINIKIKNTVQKIINVI